MRRWIPPFLMCTLFLFASCVSPSTARETGVVRIGMYADLSSSGAREGNDAVKGAQLRVKQANAEGGIGGRNLELVAMDAKQSPTEAVKAFTTLVEHIGMSAVIGAAVMNAGTAVSPVADLMKVPLISLGVDDRVTTPDILPATIDAPGSTRRYSFLIRPTSSQLAASMAAYAVEHFAQKRYAALFDPADPLSAIQARAFESVVKKAGKTFAASIELPPDPAEYPAAVRKTMDASAEVVFVCGSTAQDLAVAGAAKQVGLEALLLGNQSWYAPQLEASDGSLSAWFVTGVSPDDSGLRELGVAYAKEYGEPLPLAAVPGWDAVGVLMAAVRKAGSSTPSRIRDALEQLSGFKTLLASADMDGKTHRLMTLPVAIMRLINGRFVTMEQRYVPRPAQGQP